MEDFVSIPVNSDLLVGQLSYAFHLALAQLKVVNISVLLNVLWIFGAGKYDKVLLQGPSKTNLGKCLTMIFGNRI